MKLPAVTIGNIAAMNPNAQTAMLALPVSGQWDFSIVPTAPIAGSVLIWRNGATHSAIVTGPDRISGYNQVGWFPALQALGPHAQLGHTSPPPRARAAGLPLADVIAEAAIVARAGQLNL